MRRTREERRDDRGTPDAQPPPYPEAVSQLAHPVAPPTDPWVTRWRFGPRLRDVVAVLLSLSFAVAWFHSVVVGPLRSQPGGPVFPEGLTWVARAQVPQVLACVVVVASCLACGGAGTTRSCSAWCPSAWRGCWPSTAPSTSRC